jgi:Uma2 family endonuclease
MAAPIGVGLTVDDLDRFPDDGVRRELIGGRLYVSAAPLPRHGRVVLRVGRIFLDYEEMNGGVAIEGPGVRYSTQDSIEPDVVYVAADAVPRPGERFVNPIVAVEVSSPSTRWVDLNEKRPLLESHGLPEFWFVDLRADRVEVYRLGDDDRYGPPVIVERGGVTSPPCMPGLDAAVDAILGPPEPQAGPS